MILKADAPIMWENPTKLKPSPNNRNKHPSDQIDRLIKLIEFHGWRHPIIVRKETGLVIAGHGRLEAAIKAKWEKVPVQFQSFESDEAAYSFMISDNAVASFAELDLSLINLDIPELGPEFDIDLLGIKDFAIEAADKYADKKEDEDSKTKHECPSCGFTWS